ncbi:DUF4960 domain-containing protein [Bacteroides sp. 214]|uniref:DUF4960 domain-containing protein n=1 Tax=Bacteroides sp. 214 TaxID=2302935 RepID=UPI0013D5F128|nr:DUF4960 domain-containing protein [Bacteroides sp. 214]
MKKNICKTITSLLAFVAISCFMACDDDKYNEIDNTGEVKILTFTANAVQETLDQKNSIINLVFKTGTDLSQVTPSFTLSEGAQVKTPEMPNGPIDFLNTVTYTIVNGNLYHDYKIISAHVSDVTYFEQFNIGIYKGTINNKERKVVVKLPIGSDVTALAPSYLLSEGAKLISPIGTTHNFTNPIEYTIEYLNETFTYTVAVELVDFRTMAFLGVPATAGDITNMDEKTAYEWFVNNFPITEYVSFKDIKEGKELNNYAVIWYHYDSYDKGGDPIIHADANDSKVIDALKTYLAQGGSMFLSSAGLTLGNVLNIAKDRGMWNNAWGFENGPSTLNDGNGIGWGMRITRNHEIFNGLRMATGETNRFWTISNGSKVKGHNVIWNLSEDWTGWGRDVTAWENITGGKQLATVHWDDDMNQRCVITEYEATDNRGAVITTGTEAYDWYHEDNSPENKYHDNIEKLTYNILNYLTK